MKGLIFTTDSVLVINRAENPKTRTSRVITDKDIIYGFDCEKDGTPIAYIDQETGDHYPPNALARYKPGEIVYVKETWGIGIQMTGGLIYKADYSGRAPLADGEKWKSPLFMPLAAARTFLVIKEVFPQRLQEITEDDAIAEGVIFTDFGEYTPKWKASLDGGNTFHGAKPQHHSGYHCGEVVGPDECFFTARGAYFNLWDSINAKRGYPYDSNPYIWAYRFEKTERP